MKEIIERKLILTKLKIVSEEKENGAYICDKEHSKLLLSYIKKLEKQAELAEHYKHLYSEVKKQKDDVVKYIKSKKAIINTDYIRIFDLFEIDEQGYTEELLRMLGEIDNE